VDSGVILGAVHEAEVRRRLLVAVAGLAGYCNAPDFAAYMNFRTGILENILGKLQSVKEVASVACRSLGKALTKGLAGVGRSENNFGEWNQ
jgi:hypothetical protein